MSDFPFIHDTRDIGETIAWKLQRVVDLKFGDREVVYIIEREMDKLIEQGTLTLHSQQDMR